VKRAAVSWRPPDRVRTAWVVTPDVVEIIHAAARIRCPTSPCMKDECRLRKGKNWYETERALFRFETWEEYWAWFRANYAGTAAKIASKEHPEQCPRAFRDNQPWNLRDKGGDSCLCGPCGGFEKKRSEIGLVFLADN
jgi:hypothetical protein